MPQPAPTASASPQKTAVTSATALDLVVPTSTPKLWLALAGIMVFLLAGGSWLLFGAIPYQRTLTGVVAAEAGVQSNAPDRVVAFVPLEEAARLPQGIEVEIIFPGLAGEGSQSLDGRVADIATVPATLDELIPFYPSPQVAEQALEAAGDFLYRVDVRPAAALALQPGRVARLRATLGTIRPIDLLLGGTK